MVSSGTVAVAEEPARAGANVVVAGRAAVAGVVEVSTGDPDRRVAEVEASLDTTETGAGEGVPRSTVDKVFMDMRAGLGPSTDPDGMGTAAATSSNLRRESEEANPGK